MPTYVLQPGGSRDLPAMPLELRIHGAGAGHCEAALIREGARVPSQELRSTGASTILTRPISLPATSVLRLTPRDGEVFPPECAVDVLLSETRRSNDPTWVRVRAVLSGLPRLDVLELAWTEDALRMKALGAGTPPPGRLTARRAYEITRTVLGRTGAGDDGAEVVVVVDDSASISEWIRAGAVSAAIDLLAGIDYVLGQEVGLDVRIGLDQQEWHFSADQAAAGVLDLLERAEPKTVFAVDPSRSASDRATVFLTDLAPESWSPGPRDVCLVLCDPSAVELVASGKRVFPLPWSGVEDAGWTDTPGFAGLVGNLVAAIMDIDSSKGDHR